MQNQTLEDFQSYLLEVLSSQEDAEEILTQLNTQPLGEGLANYVRTFDPIMVDVAASLVKKWGQRISIN